jgi:hypothetical protein
VKKCYKNLVKKFLDSAKFFGTVFKRYSYPLDLDLAFREVFISITILPVTYKLFTNKKKKNVS